MLLHLSVILFTGGSASSQYASLVTWPEEGLPSGGLPSEGIYFLRGSSFFGGLPSEEGIPRDMANWQSVCILLECHRCLWLIFTRPGGGGHGSLAPPPRSATACERWENGWTIWNTPIVVSDKVIMTILKHLQLERSLELISVTIKVCWKYFWWLVELPKWLKLSVPARECLSLF